jgi:aldehyde:ferredoxin oxidoreductase
MIGGFAGKILRINLTSGDMSTLETENYAAFGGGHGIGSALFWELCTDKTVDAFHPGNVFIIMTSPLTGTLAPAVAGRTEVQAIGALAYPHNWYTRGNFGGRFGAMLKYAGWDGIVIEGKAEKPVWLDIRDRRTGGKINADIKDASSLWGLDSWETQKRIWREVRGGKDFDWVDPDDDGPLPRTTQKPAVMTIGKAGENLVRDSAILHDAGSAAGNAGFGAVWGSKNLKAVSVFGTGGIKIANPQALIDARTWFQKFHSYNVDNPRWKSPAPNMPIFGLISAQPGMGQLQSPMIEPARPLSCLGCPMGCRRRTASGRSNESQCDETYFYDTKEVEVRMSVADLAQQTGFSAYHMGMNYVRALNKMGVLGPGKELDCDLPFDKFGSHEFMEKYVDMVVNRKGIGNDLAEGVPRACKKWGKWEDVENGIVETPYWGYRNHYEGRVDVEWSYGTIFTGRDVNEHGLTISIHWPLNIFKMFGMEPVFSAEELVKRISAAVPGSSPKWFDYSEEGIYSEERIKEISWHRRYGAFFIKSMLFCDWGWPRFIDYNNPDDYKGNTPEGEVRMINAVTGQNLKYEDGLEIGRRIFNLNRSIWAMQGRHRDHETFARWMFDRGVDHPYFMPVYINGEWKYSDSIGRKLDRKKWEDFKTRFYKHEGWDPTAGRPKRKTLEDLGLGYVADELEKNGKLGKG